MGFTRRLWTAALAAVALGGALAPAALGQTGGSFAITWSSIAGGGGGFSTAAGTGLQLAGTIGQLDTSPLTGGSYALKGGMWSFEGNTLVDVEDDRPQIPTSFHVYASTPNPFHARTTIAFDLPSEQRVQMAVYSVNGELARTLIDDVLPAGRHSMTWAGIGDDGRPLPAGIYWVRTQAKNQRDVRKLVLVK